MTPTQTRTTDAIFEGIRHIAERTHKPGEYRLEGHWKHNGNSLEDLKFIASDRETNNPLIQVTLDRLGSHGGIQRVRVAELAKNPEYLGNESIRRYEAKIIIERHIQRA